MALTRSASVRPPGADSLQTDEEAAVYKQRGSRHIAGKIGSEENHDVGDVFRSAEAAERQTAVEIGALLRVGPVAAVDVGLDSAQHHRVAADLVRAKGDRDRLHQRMYAGLGRCVMGLAPPTSALIDEIAMIAPLRPCLTIRFAAAWLVKNAPPRLTSITLRESSTGNLR